MNRQEVLERLEPVSGQRVRTIDHAPNTRVQINPEITLIKPGSGGKLIPLSEPGVTSLAKFTGVPAKMKVSDDLMGRLLTELLSRKERYNVILDGDGNGVNFTQASTAKPLNMTRVLRAIEQGIKGEVEFSHIEVSPEWTTLECVGDVERPVLVGDIVRAGATIRFSPMNTRVPEVQSSVVRLICINRLTNEHVLRRFTGGSDNGNGGGGGADDGGELYPWLRHSVKAAYQAVDEVVERYRRMRDELIPEDHREEAIEAIIRGAHLRPEQAQRVRDQAILAPPETNYDLLQLITWAATHVIDTADGRERALRMGAALTTPQDSATQCPTCHRNHPRARH